MQPNKQTNFVGCFSVFWIVITSGGVFFNSAPIVNFTLLFDVLLVITQLALSRKNFLSRFGLALGYFTLMAVCVVFSILVNSDYSSLLSYSRLVLILALALSTSFILGFNKITEVFTKVVLVLASASVVLFYSEFVDNNAGLFPVIDFHDFKYVNAVIYLFFDSVERRNFGIFIEPGLYQIYLNLAIFSLLYSERDIKYKYLFVGVLFLALYSTASTTGFILGAVIFGGLAFRDTGNSRNIVLLSIKSALIVCFIGFVVMSEFFVTNVEEKFNSDKQLSLITRQNSTLIDFLIIAESPLVGAGVGAYQSSLDKYDAGGLSIDAATNTFSQLGAIVGLPFLLLVVWRALLFIFRLRVDLATKLVLLILYVVCFSTEPFVLYPLFYLPVFLSFQFSGNKKSLSVTGR